MEELKKDVESVKQLSGHKSFLENVNDLSILKTRPVSRHPPHQQATSPSPAGTGSHAAAAPSLYTLQHTRQQPETAPAPNNNNRFQINHSRG